MVNTRGGTRRQAVVVGGGGFLGATLASELLASGYAQVVTCMDICFDEEPFSSGKGTIHNLCCDLTDPGCADLLDRTFKRAHTVFLVAGYGMSGCEQLNAPKVRAVNLDGTRRVVEACRTAGVPRLVYCSTYNAVFVGQKIEGLGEPELAYPADGQFVDEYSRTKSLAERMVLDANASDIDAEGLATCCIRPAAIWGAGEKRHFARVNRLIDAGLFCFRFGNPIVDFVHVSNLTRAFILAGWKLKDRNRNVAGNVFFISDGAPVDGFDFFCQLRKAKGFGDVDTLWRVPYWVVYAMAIFFELVHRFVGIQWQPWMLTRAEVMKSGITHYASIERARRHLGYDPKSFSFDEVIEQWCTTKTAKKTE